MNVNMKSLIFIIFLILLLAINSVSAIDDNITSTMDCIEPSNDCFEIDDDIISVNNLNDSNDCLESEDDEIIVSDWDELQYYCSLNDKDYTLKLREDTNFYPSDFKDANKQIKINNNVKIIGSKGSYFGDITPDGGDFEKNDNRYITYTPIVVPENNGRSMTVVNVTFKWIHTLNTNAGLFMELAGNREYEFDNCLFDSIQSIAGSASIIHLKKGKGILNNCSIINCTVAKGCINVYSHQSLVLRDCYFAYNYGYEHSTCVMNWGNLLIYNTKFYKNRSQAWAGGITTYGEGNTTIYNSNFTDNVAGWNGGALYVYNIVNIYNTTFEGNNCTTNNGGGAIGACQYSGIPRLYVDGCLFKDNNNNCWALDELSTTGTGRGGAISFMDVGTIDIRNSLFIANSASIGTAICAWEAGSYGSPDIYITNNTFINHTRAGDVLNVRVAGTTCKVLGNHYIGNSIEFSSLTLTSLSTGNDEASFKITAKLAHPSYYESDILDKTLYDVYINNKYVKTVNTTEFTVDFGDLDICNVYVIPSISNQKTNEVTVTSTREYIFASPEGNDNNNGTSRSSPVKSITKALELALNCRNIILLGGNYSENVNVGYDVTIKGENNAVLTNTSTFNVDAVLTLKNLNVNNLNTDKFIKGSNVVISSCIFENNIASSLIEAEKIDILKSIFINNDALIISNQGFAKVRDSIILNNTDMLQGSSNYSLDYNWWGNTFKDFTRPNDLNISSWLVLNATPDVNKLENNHRTQVQFAFYSNGTRYQNMPEITLTLTPVNGSVDISTTSAYSKVAFTLTGFSNASLIAGYNNIEAVINFEFLKSNPDINIESDDIMVGDVLFIQITTPSDAKGNITVSISNITKTSEITGSNTVFNFTNLNADNYMVNVSYSGDEKYQTQTKTVNVNVNRYVSNTMINLGEIIVDEDFLIEISVPDDATGNVSLYINNNLFILTLNDAKANHTINNISRGDYIIKAVYNGNDKYMESMYSVKIEVDNINSSMEITADDIVYGSAAVINVKLDDNATGNVTVTVDGITNTSEVKNGSVTILLSNIDAGIDKNITVFYTGDDTYFNMTETGTFTVNKADLTFTISSEDIKIGKDAIIRINVPAKTGGTFTIGEDIIVIPLSGSVEYVLHDLEIGEYEITATYNGNNYNTVSNSTSFNVLEYPAPQWANSGADGRNTVKSAYESTINGEVAFIISIPDEIVGSLTIDSEGNIYITTSDAIYSYDNLGNLRYVFTPDTRESSFSGTAIGRDVVISPKSGDTLYFINQSSGEKYGSSNIYQASSTFAPVIDSNANVYIVSEYQVTAGRYNLVKIPYSMWEFGGVPILVNLEKTAPLSSPTVSEDIVVVLSEGRLRVLDAATLKSLFIKAGDFKNIRPVIGEGNVVYAVLDDSIVAYSISGSQLWKTKITGGAGNQLLLDSEFLYTTNAKGNLLKYNLTTGKESLVFTSNITSGVLIAQNGNLYFGSGNMFYEITHEGKILWKSDLESKITGTPVMDKNGTIYVTSSDNKLYALKQGELKDPDLNIIVNDDVLTITMDNECVASLSSTLNGKTYSTNTISISNLAGGKYLINVTYNGDARFANSTKSFTFAVKDKITDVKTDVKDSTVTFTLPGDATGTLTIKINGKTYNKNLVNGKASITLVDGTYNAVVTYSGSDKYAGFTKTVKVTVKKQLIKKQSKIVAKKKTFKAKTKIKKYTVTLKSGSTPIKNVKLTIKIKKKTFKATTNAKGKATFKITKLNKGKYTAVIRFAGNSLYKAATRKVKIVVK